MTLALRLHYLINGCQKLRETLLQKLIKIIQTSGYNMKQLLAL